MMSSADSEATALPVQIPLANLGQFRLTPEQAQYLVNNLPAEQLQSLLQGGWFLGEQGKIKVSFSLTPNLLSRSINCTPTVKLEVSDRVYLLNFNFSDQSDPIVALVILWIMWRDCPEAFYLVPCNATSYWEEVFGQKKIYKMQRFGFERRGFRGEIPTSYTELTEFVRRLNDSLKKRG